MSHSGTRNDAGSFDADHDETIEDFNDATLVPGLTITTDAGTLANSQFEDRVTRSGGEMTLFTFASPIKAFGGFFNLTPGGVAQLLRFSIDGVDVGTQTASVSGFQFFGFSSTTAFSSVKIVAGTGSGNAETYHLDNLRFAAAAVPEPATWAMMILGFGLIGGAMRSRQTAKVRFAI